MGPQVHGAGAGSQPRYGLSSPTLTPQLGLRAGSEGGGQLLFASMMGVVALCPISAPEGSRVSEALGVRVLLCKRQLLALLPAAGLSRRLPMVAGSSL